VTASITPVRRRQVRRRLRACRLQEVRRSQDHRRPGWHPVPPGRSKATDSTLIKALSRAWRWQQLLDAGAYGSIAEMADKEGINRSYQYE
jgi:hypothetical protein